MKKLTRGLAIALLLGAAPVGIYAAYAARDGGWHKMSAESIERLQDGKLAAAKVSLKLDDAQGKLWVPVEEQIRAEYKSRAAMRAERETKRADRKAEKELNKDAGAKPERPNMAERFQKLSERLSARAETMKAFSVAFTPFYASLNEDQKAVLGPVMKDLKFGPHGSGRGKGPRWAESGWGGDRGGHHGGKGWVKQGEPGEPGSAPETQRTE